MDSGVPEDEGQTWRSRALRSAKRGMVPLPCIPHPLPLTLAPPQPINCSLILSTVSVSEGGTWESGQVLCLLPKPTQASPCPLTRTLSPILPGLLTEAALPPEPQAPLSFSLSPALVLTQPGTVYRIFCNHGIVLTLCCPKW